MKKDLSKENGEGFQVRFSKATSYTAIGLTVGFILGFLVSTVLTHRQVLEKDSNRIALSEEYTAVIVQRERLDENGDIWIRYSKVTEVYR